MMTESEPAPASGEQGGAQRLLAARVKVFPLPPPDFHPVTASPEDIQLNHLPPRPDPERQPALYAGWLRLFSPPVAFVDPRIRLVTEEFQLNPSLLRPADASAITTSRYERSGNWSGALIAPGHGSMFVLVAGVWTVPMLTLPPAAERVQGASQYVCSTWIGLDGARRYLNSSLPQIGTMQTLDVATGGAPLTTVQPFFQWWDVETGGSFIQLTGLPTQVGDVMIGAVWAFSSTEVIAYLRNLNTGQLALVGCTAPVVTKDGVKVQLTISGATAEWVLERPTKFDKTARYPFPNYGDATFCACWAGTAPNAGVPDAAREPVTPRLIRMFDVMHDPTRAILISMARKRSDSAVHLSYGGFPDI